MIKIYKPISYTWETQFVINSVIHEYEEPDENYEYDPFDYYNPWEMHIIYSPIESIENSQEEEFLEEETFENLSPEPWEIWSEQLFC